MLIYLLIFLFTLALHKTDSIVEFYSVFVTFSPCLAEPRNVYEYTSLVTTVFVNTKSMHVFILNFSTQICTKFISFSQLNSKIETKEKNLIIIIIIIIINIAIIIILIILMTINIIIMKLINKQIPKLAN